MTTMSVNYFLVFGCGLQVMSIRVGREQFGEEISCDVTNSDFPHLRMSSRYMINITCKYELLS